MLPTLDRIQYDAKLPQVVDETFDLLPIVRLLHAFKRLLKLAHPKESRDDTLFSLRLNRFVDKGRQVQRISNRAQVGQPQSCNRALELTPVRRKSYEHLDTRLGRERRHGRQIRRLETPHECMSRIPREQKTPRIRK